MQPSIVSNLNPIPNDQPPVVPDQRLKVSRRTFLGIAFFGTIGLLILQWIGAILTFLKPRATSEFGGEILAGRVEEFPPNTVSYVSSGRFYISRLDDGMLALYQRCTHLGCAVPWVEGETEFHCPCHGSLFNTVGEVTGGPAPRPMDIFQIEIRDGEVWVDTGTAIVRDQFDPDQLTVV